jgi:hypothetical protein
MEHSRQIARKWVWTSVVSGLIFKRTYSPGYDIFLTLGTLLGKVLIFFKNIPEPWGIVQFIFFNS